MPRRYISIRYKRCVTCKVTGMTCLVVECVQTQGGEGVIGGIRPALQASIIATLHVAQAASPPPRAPRAPPIPHPAPPRPASKPQYRDNLQLITMTDMGSFASKSSHYHKFRMDLESRCGVVWCGTLAGTTYIDEPGDRVMSTVRLVKTHTTVCRKSKCRVTLRWWYCWRTPRRYSPLARSGR